MPLKLGKRFPNLFTIFGYVLLHGHGASIVAKGLSRSEGKQSAWVCERCALANPKERLEEILQADKYILLAKPRALRRHPNLMS
jgi:hypothetical protein